MQSLWNFFGGSVEAKVVPHDDKCPSEISQNSEQVLEHGRSVPPTLLVGESQEAAGADASVQDQVGSLNRSGRDS